MKLYLTRFTSTLFLTFICFFCFGQFKLDQPIPSDPNVRIRKLSNGLTYYIRKNEKPANKVELRLVVKAGSVLEEKDQQGLAHFMEHMNFNGSKHFPKNELVDYLQKVGVKFGADLNAYTSFDQTVYILPISTDNPDVVEKGFTVLEDWAGNNLLDTTEINKERGVVLEESRLSKGAGERMSRQYFPVLFNGSKYAERLPIGKDSILKTFRPAALTRFYKQWYRPDLMAVVVVGDLDPAVAEKKIKEHFSNFKNPVHEQPRPSIIPIKERTKPEAMVLTDDEATNTILEVFNFIRPSTKVKTWADYRALTIRNMVNSLINQRLQELTQKENPPFVYGFTGMQSFIHGYETFVSFAVLGDNSSEEAINALIAETDRARQFGFLPSELERVKANLLNQAEQAYNERNKSESGSLVNSYVNNFLEGSPIPGIENRYKFLQQIVPTITLQEVNAEAAKIPSTSHAFALITAPAKMKDKLPTNSQLSNEIVAANNQKVTPYEEKVIATRLMEKEPTPGKITAETKDEKINTTNLTLSNGVTVTLKPTTFKNDEIMLDAWRPGGYNQFPLTDKDNAEHAAMIVSQMGVKDLSPTDLEKFLSGKSVNVQPYINDHEEGIEGMSSVKDFETFLQLIHLYFTQPRKDESLFKSYVKKEKDQIKFLKQNPRFFYQDTLNKILYNNNPWMDQFPSEEEFDHLDMNKALAIYNQIYGNASGMHFTFVGNVDPNTAKPLLEKYLGSLPSAAKEPAFKDNGARPVKGVVTAAIKKGKEQQSMISVIFTGETTYDPKERLALKALLDALNIKIVEKLREEMSGIYTGGMNGDIERIPYTHYTVYASLPCGPENVDKLTAALFDLIRSAQQNGIEQKDLDKVKETWRKKHAVDMQDNNSWLNALSYSWLVHDDPDEVLNYEKRVDALTLQDIQQAAQKFLNLNNYVKAVLYPENAQVTDQKKAF